MSTVILHALEYAGASARTKAIGMVMEEIREQGRHAYSALLFGLTTARRTGILELEYGRDWRKLYLVRGTPVLYESSLDTERLSKTIVQAGLVAEKPLSKLIPTLQLGEQLEERLISDGLVGPEELHAHKRTRLERGATAGLTWAEFNFRFRANDGLSAAIDQALVPLVRPLRGLWMAIKKQIPMDTALAYVAAEDAGEIQGTPGLPEVLEAMEVEAPLDNIGDILAQGHITFEDLFGQINDKSGHLAALVWLLEVTGTVVRGGRSQCAQLAQLSRGVDLPGEEPLVVVVEPKEPVTPPPDTSAKKKPKKKPKKKREKKASEPSPSDTESRNRTASHLPELLATARNHRAGKDFYSFLDVGQDADQAEIVEAYERYTNLWESAAATVGLPPQGQEDAGALLSAAKRAFDTLRKKKTRKAYDAKLALGLTPGLVAVEERPADRSADGPGSPDLEAAQAFIEQGKPDLALKLLRQLRVNSPSDPTILAALGWAVWLSKDNEDESAEEFLQLALTFNPDYVQALEYLGRIAEERQDAEALSDLLERVTKLDENNAWALKVTSATAEDSGKRKKKRGFWRRGD